MTKPTLRETIRATAAGLAAAEVKPLAPAAENGAVVVNAAPDRSVKLLRPDEIDPDPRGQPRKHFDAEKHEQLKLSLKSGQLQNIVVYPTTNGRFVIVVGERRWRAGLELFAEDKNFRLSCRVLKEEPKSRGDIIAMQLGENEHRSDLTFSERLASYRELMELESLNLVQLAARVHKDVSTVSKALSIEENTSPELKAAVDAKATTVKALYEVSQITDPEKRAEMEKGLLDGSLNEEAVRTERKKQKKRTKRGRPAKTKKEAPAKVTVPTYSEGVDVAGGFRVVVVCNGHTDSPGNATLAEAAEAGAAIFRQRTA